MSIKLTIAQNKARNLRYGRLWREKNRERIKQYRIDNKDRIAQLEREYRLRNREKRTKQFRNLVYGGNVDLVYKKYNYACWFCCKSDETLHIHHKDGKGFNEFAYKANNKITNLTLLCASCHRKIHSLIRIYNKGLRE